MSGLDEGFRIDSPDKAAWAMRKYRRLAQKQLSNQNLAASEMARIDEWLTRVNAPVLSEMKFFSSHLEAYAIGQRALGQKSIDLIDGTIKTRAQAAGVKVDRFIFIEWAIEAKRFDLLRVSYDPDLEEIKTKSVIDGRDVIDVSTGEVIPGAEPRPEKVTVSIAPDLAAIDLEGLDDESQ